jgi:hypothetical protein
MKLKKINLNVSSNMKKAKNASSHSMSSRGKKANETLLNNTEMAGTEEKSANDSATLEKKSARAKKNFGNVESQDVGTVEHENSQVQTKGK